MAGSLMPFTMLSMSPTLILRIAEFHYHKLQPVSSAAASGMQRTSIYCQQMAF
jgi:hypothetical protein